jgi:predicted amidophosphoribosyltransferase
MEIVNRKTRPISKENVERILDDGLARRIDFSRQDVVHLRRSQSPYVGAFNVPFPDNVKRLLEAETGIIIQKNRNRSDNGFWFSIRTEEEFRKIENWMQTQGSRIFMRDCLDMSISLGQNFPDVGSAHTEIGSLEDRCKEHNDIEAITIIADRLCSAITDMHGYREAKFVAAVPARPGKGYDLPTSLAAAVAVRLKLTDLTSRFSFGGQKGSIKATKLENKWAEWEQAALKFQPFLNNFPSVILIDDKYQSGVTIQFVASKLRAAGAGEIYGLCVVKTLRDTDNS